MNLAFDPKQLPLELILFILRPFRLRAIWATTNFCVSYCIKRKKDGKCYIYIYMV